MPKNKSTKLTKDDLARIVDHEIDSAAAEGELEFDRNKAMNSYLGKPRGDEITGRSQVQDRSLFEVVEWIMPSLIRIFTDENSVTIDPVGPEDVEQAEQETDYLNYLIFKKNDGFLLLYTWFKDALLQKNGIIKKIVETEKEVCRETYQGLTDEGFIALLSEHEDAEVVEYSTETVFLGQAPITLHNVTISYEEDEQEICIYNVPPEKFLISKDARSVDPSEARFVAHEDDVPVSELREMGYSEDEIDLMEDSEISIWTESEIVRNSVTEESSTYDVINEAMKTKRIYECYTKVDMNGDGMAESIKVTRSGDFIDYEEIDYCPFNALTPNIMPHRFNGLSIHDYLKEIEDIRTGLMRSYMDNIYQSINGTTYYDKNTVNLDDMLVSTPYGIRAVDGPPGNSVVHIPSSGLSPTAFSLLEMTDAMKQSRVGDFQAQIDPNLLANVQTGVVMRLTMEAKAKTEMIARIFAETGVKKLYQDLHGMAITYGHVEDTVKLRNNWVNIDPTRWKDRYDFTVKVGLGNPNKEERLSTLREIIGLQSTAVDKGGMGQILVPDNLYNAVSDYTKLLGYEADTRYWTSPQAIPPPPPPPPDPQMISNQIYKEVEDSKRQVEMADLQLKGNIAQQDAAYKQMQLSYEAEKTQYNNMLNTLYARLDELKESAKIADAANKAALEQKALESEERIKAAELIVKDKLAEQSETLEKYRIDLDAAMKAAAANQGSVNNTLFVQILDMLEKLENRVSREKEPEEQDIEYNENGQIIRMGKKRVIRDATGKPVRIERLP